MKKIIIVSFTFFFLCSNHSFSQSSSAAHTPEPYTKEEFAGWIKQVRRTEIITLGSLPFTMLTVTLGFTLHHWLILGQQEYAIEFGGTSSRGLTTFSGFTYEEQIQILTISASISLAIGLADFIWSMAKSKREKQRQQMPGLPPNVTVTETTIDSSRDD